MKKIIEKIITIFVLSLSIYGVSFANIDSTRASWIAKFDVNYLWTANKCGYSIWYVLGFHEWYLRKYVSLVPVPVNLDSIINQVNISTFGCSYDTWKNKLSSNKKICSNSYLKTPFFSTDSLWVYDSWTFLSLSITWNLLRKNDSTITCNWKCYINLLNINNIVGNRTVVSKEFPIDLTWWKISFFDTGIIVYSWTDVFKTLNWSNMGIYPWYSPISKYIKKLVYWQKYEVTYKYLNYKLLWAVEYDLEKLYNYKSFRNLWHWLTKVWDALVIKPIWWKNYNGYKSMYFDGSRAITQGNWTAQNVLNYKNNLCHRNYEAWARWWIAKNYGGKKVTSFAKSLGMSPLDHSSYTCASTWLKIKYNYFDGKRTDKLYVSNINIWINVNGSITRKESINKCNINNSNWKRPSDAHIDVSKLELKINGENSYKDPVENKFINYTTDKNKVCMNNIKIKSVPMDYVWGANHVHVEYRDITAIQMIIRPRWSRINLGESNMVPVSVSKSDVPKNLNNICFNIDWNKNKWRNAFKKPWKYWFLLKFWSNDEIRGNTALMNIKIIPNNSYQINSLSHNSNIKADGRHTLVFTGKITDSFWNIIKLSSRLISDYSIWNNIIDRDETTHLIQNWLFSMFPRYLEDWLFKLYYVAYNKKVMNNKPSLTLWVRKRLLNGNLGNVVHLSKEFTLPNINWIFNIELLTWANNWNSLPFNTDVKFKLQLKNTGSSKLTNMKIKFIPKFEINGSSYTWVKFVPSTWSIVLKNMLDWNYNLGVLNPNNTKDIYFTGRIEYSGNNNSFDSKIQIKWKVLLDYVLDWSDWDKSVKTFYDVNSNLNINYWWVYIEWLASNAVKWLYEILRKDKNYQASTSSASDLKIKTYNKIVQNSNKLIRWVEKNKEISLTDIWWIYSNDGQDITLNWWNITKKSLIYVKWADVIIKWNIKEKWWLLTIVAVWNSYWEWWHIYIDKDVTNIDAIMISQNWIYPLLAKNWKKLKIWSMLEVVKWNKNSELNNQLLIYGMVISRSNTVWWSIRINGKYVEPWWKYVVWNTANFYRAAVYDLNYLRRYNVNFNPWRWACKITDINYKGSCDKIDLDKYGTYPVIIEYNPKIQTDNPYWF